MSSSSENRMPTANWLGWLRLSGRVPQLDATAAHNRRLQAGCEEAQKEAAKGALRELKSISRDRKLDANFERSIFV